MTTRFWRLVGRISCGLVQGKVGCWCHRIASEPHVDDDRAYRFAEWLGFENEGIMRKYGVDGGDYYRMARVA
jgi:hypothetical protein